MASYTRVAGSWAACMMMGAGILFPGAFAATDAVPYYPPAVAYVDDLRQTVIVPQKVNINTSGLNQLKGLPGFNEELALKVIRCRPCSGFPDLMRKVPGLSRKNIELLIQQIEPKVIFK